MTRFINSHDYNIQFYSGCEYENLTAEIYFRDKLVATVLNEGDVGAFQIEFPEGSSAALPLARRVDFDGFSEIIQTAKSELLNRRKTND